MEFVTNKSKIIFLAKKLSVTLWMTLIVTFGISVSFQVDQSVSSQQCNPSKETFQIMTGFAFKAPSSAIELVSGNLQLTECLSICRRNLACRAVNFAMGVCGLFNSSAQEQPNLLASSQLHVLTTYAEKICLDELPCSREWIFERVSNYKLLQRSRRIMSGVTSIEKCMELCLKEISFKCRSANYYSQRNECHMSDLDRYSVPNNFHKFFIPAENGTIYLENNCVDLSERFCGTSTIPGKILDTVDAVFQDVKTLEGCREKCLRADFRCQSFDLGDPQNSVCRLSHTSSPSLFNMKIPYSEVLGSATYEISSCYTVSIKCRSREMVAVIQASKVLNGKVYAKSQPNSCVKYVRNSLYFEIKMPYHDLDCDVKDEGNGKFSNEIFIQHHDIIVTNQDVGMKLQCQYNLNNLSLAHGVRLETHNKEDSPYPSHRTNVAAPNVSMRVTDRKGRDRFQANVGDPLLLTIQVIDLEGPYGVLVRELVAVDDTDTNKMVLIDSVGCPTDPSVVEPIIKSHDNSAIVHVPFYAFKFATSGFVQFKALIIPCLAACETTECGFQSKKERLIKRNLHEITEEEGKMVVTLTIHITEKLTYDVENLLAKDSKHTTTTYILTSVSSKSLCLNIPSLVSIIAFLLIPLIIVI